MSYNVVDTEHSFEELHGGVAARKVDDGVEVTTARESRTDAPTVAMLNEDDLERIGEMSEDEALLLSDGSVAVPHGGGLVFISDKRDGKIVCLNQHGNVGRLMGMLEDDTFVEYLDSAQSPLYRGNEVGESPYDGSDAIARYSFFPKNEIDRIIDTPVVEIGRIDATFDDEGEAIIEMQLIDSRDTDQD